MITKPPIRGPFAVALALTALLVAGCGGSVSEAEGGPSSAPSVPVTSAQVTAAESPCASAQPEIEAGSKASGFVDSVEVESCDQANVRTTLGTSKDDAQSAVAICGIAANEASQHGVTRTSVLAADGTELAFGSDATDCGEQVS